MTEALFPQSIFECFSNAASRHADRPFLHIPAQATRAYCGGPVDFSYAQAQSAVAALSDQYRRLGIGLGHRVVMALDNRAEMILHLLALNALGASAVPLNMEMRAPEKAYLISHSDAVLIVALAEHRADLEALGSLLDRTVPVTSPGLEPVTLATDASAGSGIARQHTEAALLYTSGTTGKPKGCMISNDYFLELGRQYAGMGGLCALEEGRERIITPLPLSHMNALCCTPMAMMMTGGCLIQLDRFSSGNWWQTVRDSKATCLHYLGVMPAMLLNAPPEPSDDFSGQIKFGFGAGVDKRHQQTFEQRFGFPLVEAWAMTETGAGGWISMHKPPRILGERCIGRPLSHTDVRLIDEAGADVATGEPGELLVRTRGDNPRRYFFSGYYKDEAATSAAWEGGWFHTGDVVRRNEAGDYFFVDRRKNVIRRSGENIAAVEVEWSLFQHPAVAACAVTPVPDELRGDEVMAFIVTADGWARDRATAESIFQHVFEQLVYFKAPGYLCYIDSLPMTASQKIMRGEVKALALAELEAGRCIDLRDRKRRPARQATGVAGSST